MPRPAPPAKRAFDLVLVLSGGNALGAFQAGAYEALHQYGLRPDWVVGASVGAVNAAIIAGAETGRRVETLRTFWRPAGFAAPLAPPWLEHLETVRRTAAVSRTMLVGRPGVFGPLLSSFTPWADDRPAAFETDQLAATLESLVDFDRLNQGACRFTATAVDLETGDDVVFDSRDRRIDARHIRASAALPVAFPPVEVDDRWLVDGGLSANLPLDPVMAAPGPRPTLCLAIDLLPLGGRHPRTIADSASRMQDLIFTAQSRRTIERWQAAYAERTEVSITLVRMAYAAQAQEVVGKAMDFSGPTIERRWAAGHAAGTRFAERLADGSLNVGGPGLTVSTA